MFESYWSQFYLEEMNGCSFPSIPHRSNIGAKIIFHLSSNFLSDFNSIFRLNLCVYIDIYREIYIYMNNLIYPINKRSTGHDN